MRPLAVHKYGFGSQSCRNRRKLLRCARLAAAKSPAHGAFWPWGRLAAPSSLSPGERRASSLGIRGRFASRCVTGAECQTPRANLNENGTKTERLYKVYGRESLDAENPWQYPTNSLHRFFKVTIEMP